MSDIKEKLKQFIFFMQMDLGLEVEENKHYKFSGCKLKFIDPKVLSIWDTWSDGYDSGSDDGANGWISVDERLPDIDEPVLLFFGHEFHDSYNRQLPARRSMVNKTDWCWYTYMHNMLITDATHWKPLDEPSCAN